MKKLTLAALAAGCATAVCLSLNVRAADATYEYSGQVINAMGYYTVDNPLPNQPSSGPAPSYPLTLNGTITLAAPLAPNLSNFSVTPSYAIFGFETLDAGGSLIATGPDPSYSGPGTVYVNAITDLTFSSLTFSTDSTGAIIGWDLTMSGTPLSFESFTATSTQSGDSARYLNFEPNSGGVNEYDVGSNSTPGTWTGPVAPEIDASSAGIAFTLLGGLIAVLTDRGRSNAVSDRKLFGSLR